MSSFNLSIFLSLFVATLLHAKDAAYIPDASLSAPKIIRRYGYPSETHVVETEDGYLLDVHRIPFGKNAKRSFRNYPVYLQHGVVATSADWIINGPSKALGYQLADRGFDVWLGNARGNTYSRSHKNLSSDNEQFWNFSFHEMGMYDVPATIDYILEHTNHSQLYYIGHSMGTCMFFVMCSMRPEYNFKIRAQISLAPVGYMHHMTSMLNNLVPFANQIQKATSWLSNGSFLPQNAASKLVSKYLCGENVNNSMLCKKYIVYKLFGEDSVQFDMSLLPIILAHNPAGTSVKTLMHFAQEITSKKFQQYDYGSEENIKIYNCSHPPRYNLSNIIAPIAFYYAKNDILADSNDVMELYTYIPNRLGLHLIEFDKFNHVDFLYSRDVFNLVYKSVINTITTAESADWAPVYDRETLFNSFNLSNCNDIEFRGRNAKKKKGFWSTITSYVKKLEIQPLIKNNEEKKEEDESRSIFSRAWKEIIHV